VLEIRWNAVAGGDGYILQRSTDGNNFTTIYQGGNARFVDQGLTAATTYYYRVQAGGSPFSAPVAITTAAATLAGGRYVADTPAILAVEMNQQSGTAVIRWTDLGPEYVYTVYKAGRIVASGNSTSYTDNNLLPIAEYAVRATHIYEQRSSVAVPTVVWNSVRQVEFKGYEYTETGIKLLWDAESDMTYEVMQRGQRLAAGLTTGEFVHTNPQASNLYVLVAIYRNPETNRNERTYSNAFAVTR
jgi:hypothetical protein